MKGFLWIILGTAIVVTTGCSGFEAVEVEWRDRGGSTTATPQPPPYEGDQYEPAGRVTAFNVNRSCSSIFPQMNQRATLQECSDICGDLDPAWSTVSSPSVIIWQCYAPGVLNDLRTRGTPPRLEILVDEAVWQTAQELKPLNRYWGPWTGGPLSRKSDCDSALPGGSVTCKFLTPLRIWRVFVCENSRRTVNLTVEDSRLIERENDAACSTVSSIEAEGITSTLPVITENQTNLRNPILPDVTDEAELQGIVAQWRGDYIYDQSGNTGNVHLGVFGTSDKVAVDFVSTDLGIEVTYFAQLTRVSFDNTDPSNRIATLNLAVPLVESNRFGVTVAGGQLRWYENNRVEIDITLTDGGVTTTYTSTKVLP